MSVEITPLVYRTRLGNLPAKSVLVLLADCSNMDGYSYPSAEKIADRTEIGLRTVLRIVQVFGAINLVSRVPRAGHKTPGLQINVAMLGKDLREEFRRAYAAAQGKSADAAQCRRDMRLSVAETLKDVSPTLFSVAETLPPHPLLGRTVIEPSEEPSPPNPLASEWGLAVIDSAVEQVMRECGFTARRLKRSLRAVLEQEAGKEADVLTTAAAMIAAWRRYIVQDASLHVKWGARRFFEEGYWRDMRSWHWDAAELNRKRLAQEAGVGRYA